MADMQRIESGSLKGLFEALLLVSDDSVPATELARAFAAAGAEVVGTYPTVSAAKSALCGESYVACGSITLAGELAGLFR